MKKNNYIKRIIQSILVFFLFYFGRYFQLIPILLFGIDIEKISDAGQIYLSIFSNIVVLALLIIIYFNELKIEWKKFQSHIMENLDIGFKYWFLGLVGMAVSNIILGVILKAGGATNEKMVQQMITTLPIFMLLNAGIIAPMIEELTFRKAFRNIISHRWVFVFVSGIVFGGLHVITSFTTPLELLYIIPYSCLGISFAYIYIKTDTIFAPISMHMFHNFMLTLLSIISK